MNKIKKVHILYIQEQGETVLRRNRRMRCGICGQFLKKHIWNLAKKLGFVKEFWWGFERWMCEKCVDRSMKRRNG